MTDMAPAASGSAIARQHLSPLTILIGVIRNIPQFGIFIPAIIWGTARFSFGMALLVALGTLTISSIFVYLRWNSFRFGYDDDELVIHSGLIATNRRAIPFDRIFDVNIEQDLLHRILGVAKMSVETGASGGDEGELNAITLKQAEAIRDAVRRYRAGLRSPQADGDRDAAPAADPVLYAMTPGRVVLSGMFSFSLILVAIIGGILNRVDNAFSVTRVIDVIESRGPNLRAYIATHLLMAMIGIVAIIMLIGVLSGIIRSILTDWGFTLTRGETGVRRVRGLFTRTDTVIPFKRIQTGLILSGPVRRTFGWLRVAVQSMGGAGQDEDRRSAGQQVLMPLANPSEADALLHALGLVAPPAQGAMQSAGLVYFLRRMIWMIPAIIPIIIGMVLDEPRWGAIAIALILLSIPVWWISGRQHRFLLTSDWLFVQNGWWKRRMVILPLSKVQTVSIDTGPIQRRLGSTTLNIGVAGVRGAVAIMDLPRQAACDLMLPLAARARTTVF